jgi:hypothetical protein
MPDDNPATQPDDDIAMTTVVAQTCKKKIEDQRTRPASTSKERRLRRRAVATETKRFARLKMNRQVADDRPPLSGPGGMLVECWPLRQRERGRRSRLT